MGARSVKTDLIVLIKKEDFKEAVLLHFSGSLTIRPQVPSHFVFFKMRGDILNPVRESGICITKFSPHARNISLQLRLIHAV